MKQYSVRFSKAHYNHLVRHNLLEAFERNCINWRCWDQHSPYPYKNDPDYRFNSDYLKITIDRILRFDVLDVVMMFIWRCTPEGQAFWEEFNSIDPKVEKSDSTTWVTMHLTLPCPEDAGKDLKIPDPYNNGRANNYILPEEERIYDDRVKLLLCH